MDARRAHRPPVGAAPGRLPQTAAGLARQGMAQRVLPRHAAHTRSPEFVTAMDALMHQAGLERVNGLVVLPAGGQWSSPLVASWVSPVAAR